MNPNNVKEFVFFNPYPGNKAPKRKTPTKVRESSGYFMSDEGIQMMYLSYVSLGYHALGT